MTKVVRLKTVDGFERHERSVKRALRNAGAAELTEVFIVGVDADGEVFVQAHPNEPGNCMWLMEMAKQRLLNPRQG